MGQWNGERNESRCLICGSSPVTLCPACRPIAARSRVQLNNRLALLEVGGDIYPCSECGSTDWATTDECVTEEVRYPSDPWFAVCVGIAASLLIGVLTWMFTR